MRGAGTGAGEISSCAAVAGDKPSDDGHAFSAGVDGGASIAELTGRSGSGGVSMWRGYEATSVSRGGYRRCQVYCWFIFLS